MTVQQEYVSDVSICLEASYFHHLAGMLITENILIHFHLWVTLEHILCINDIRSMGDI